MTTIPCNFCAALLLLEQDRNSDMPADYPGRVHRIRTAQVYATLAAGAHNTGDGLIANPQDHARLAR